MRLSRTDLVPVLVIIAGGAVGFSLSAGILMPSLLLLSRSDDVPAPVPVVALATPESPTRVAARAGTVTGRVSEAETGLPVAAVQVFISSLDLGGLSQRNGRYLLQNVPVGTYTLTVARIGYQTTQVQIAVASNQTVEQNFTISEGDPARAPYPYRFVPTQRSVRPSRD